MAVAPTRLTVQDVRDRVLARLGMGAAATASPEVLDQVVGSIGSIQRTLCLTEEWLLPAKRLVLTVSQGRRWLPLPCQPEGLERVTWQQGAQDPVPLMPGLTAEDRPAVDLPAGQPAAYDIMITTGVVSVTVGAGGSGYVNGATATFADPGGVGYAARGVLAVTAGAITGVTITDQGADYAAAPAVTTTPGTGASLTAVLGDVWALYVAPIPAIPGSVVIQYRDVPPMAPALTDRLVVDEELIVLYTMAATAPAAGQRDDQPALAGRAGDYLDRLRQARPSGGGLTFSPLQAARGRR